MTIETKQELNKLERLRQLTARRDSFDILAQRCEIFAQQVRDREQKIRILSTGYTGAIKRFMKAEKQRDEWKSKYMNLRRKQ